MLVFVLHLCVGLSYQAWDNDVYYYQRVAMALEQGDAWQAFNHYVPLLFAWIWGLLGTSNHLLILLFQASLSTLCLLPVAQLCRRVDPKISVMVAMVFVGFQASLMRYGMQPLPDTLYLFLHLLLLAELSAESPRAKVLFPTLMCLPWVRYDAFIFFILYALWAALFHLKNKRVWGVCALGVIAGLGLLSLNSKIRHDSWHLTPRFASLYSQVGEDQLVEGQTLWHRLAVKGELARKHSSDVVKKALEDPHRRESENASSVSLLCQNFFKLLTFKLFADQEQLGFIVLFFVLVGLYQAPRFIVATALMSVASVGVYSFLGVNERYLAFAIPLWLIVAARGVSTFPYQRFAWFALVVWCLWQLKVASYHRRHPEVQRIEYRLAGEWIAKQGVKGPILSREGLASIYSHREWRRLPTSSDVDDIINYAQQEGASYFVVGSRYFAKKRPWQKTWLNDFPAKKIKEFTHPQEGKYKVVVYQLKN